MEKMNYLATLAYVKAANAVSEFKKDERGIDGIVIAIILIGIALLIAIFFKDAIMDLLETLIEKIKEALELG